MRSIKKLIALFLFLFISGCSSSFSNKQLLYSFNGKIVVGELNGQVVQEWYPNPALRGFIKVKQFSLSGDLLIEAELKERKIHGRFALYNRFGIVVRREYFKNGQREGLSEIFYGDGRVKEQCEYKAGKRDGYFASFAADGDTVEFIQWKSGVLHGFSKSFDESGKLSEVQQWYNGKEEGNAYLFDKVGNVIKYRYDFPGRYSHFVLPIPVKEEISFDSIKVFGLRIKEEDFEIGKNFCPEINFAQIPGSEIGLITTFNEKQSVLLKKYIPQPRNPILLRKCIGPVQKENHLDMQLTIKFPSTDQMLEWSLSRNW